MNNKLLLLGIFCSLPFLSAAQLSLTIEICSLRNTSGQIHLELNNDMGKRVAGHTTGISGNTCSIIIENLKPGRYAFKFFHDENKNEKLDVNWLGIPKEGFGFSNEPAMMFGPPSFSKTLFELKESKVIRCKAKYF